MKTKKEIFKIGITISEFGNLAKFYKTYAKGNRIIEVDGVEFEGTSEQHNTGVLNDTIICEPRDLKMKVIEFICMNSLQQECFSITKDGSKKIILTEEDLG